MVCYWPGYEKVAIPAKWRLPLTSHCSRLSLPEDRAASGFVLACSSGTVYKPARTYASALIASLAVFVASGLFHEWMVHAVFLYNKQSEGVILGSNTAFFVWNFIVIACERMLVATKGVQSLKKVLPRFMVTVMIIMSSLPFAHWFGGPYLNGNFFSDYEIIVPMIRKM